MRPVPRQTTSVVSSFANQGQAGGPASPSSTAGEVEFFIPAVCLDVCNNAYLVFQQIGINPSLCDPAGPFREYSEQCASCLEANWVGPNGNPPWSEGIAYCDTNPVSATSTVHYTIPTSWLTKSTTLSVATFSGLVEGGVTTDKVYTVVVDVLATRSDWTGFGQSTGLTTGAGSTETGDNGGGSQAWIAGPVIGGVAGLAILVGIYLFFARRRKRSQNPEETWTGKPELDAESVPGPPKTPLEVDAEPRPPQELEGSYYTFGGQQTHWGAAELTANEVAAREMDVNSPGQELEAPSLSRPPAGNI
ncbi:hypothetical protein F5144DRAFT_557393 [Chaetomium tenue]|uniref:Uncharacterized protein n=1 Tax=Chaetomium tenue TaxID=1854479 RepID=A0ACB7PTD3_9PEZI|nr:hypothetical protein F5144DRAFT_557393 [Chaetomium globosum]